MEVKPGYKQTEVGVIPEEWEVKPLGDIGGVRMCKRVLKHQTRDHGDVPFYKIGTFGGVPDAFISHSLFDEFKRKYSFPQKGDVLISAAGTIGRTVIYDGVPAYFQDSNIVWIENDETKASNAYLWHRYQVTKWAVSHGGTVARLYNDSLRTKIHIPLPPLSEQRAIAAALSDVDGLLGGLDRLIAKKRDLKQAAMQQLLTGQSRLPGFHGEWEVKQLGDVATLNRLNVVPASWPSQTFVHFSLPAFDAGKAPVVELGVEIGSNKFRVPQGAVLVSKLNPRIPRVWAPAGIPDDSIASTEFLVLTPKDGVSRRFLFILCASPRFCEQMELAATGTTGSHQRISPSGALSLKVFVPIDPAEQTAIAEVLSEMDGELAVLEQRREKTRALKQAMMQELLTGRTRLI